MNKINKIKLITVFTIIFMATSALTKTTEMTVYNQKISFDLPTEWQVVNKEVGIPVKLIGPVYNERRPVILFVPIDLKEEKLILDDKDNALASYKIGRLAWLQTFNGKSISFLPISSYFTDNNRIEVHQFGHLYNFDNSNFEEKSFYVRCKNQTFHLKSLILVEHLAHWNSTIKKLTDSFRCE